MTTEPNDGPVLIFDVECGICARSIRFVLRHERGAVLRFAPRQSEAGRRLRAEHGVPELLESMVLIEGGRAWLQSDAVLRTARYLRLPWRACTAIRIVPRALRDRA